MDPVDLERSLDRALKQLPAPRAPKTLLPRVMAAARQSLLPWYRRPWVTWPVAAQLASVALLVIVVANLIVLFPFVQGATAALASRLTVPAGLVEVAYRAREAAALMNAVLQLVVQPLAAYMFALAIAFSIACSALWTALNRVALGGASHQ